MDCTTNKLPFSNRAPTRTLCNTQIKITYSNFYGGTLNWSKMVKMVKMVGILGAFLGEKKGEGSWVQS